MTTEPMTLNDLLLACAGATLPCPKCQGTGSYSREGAFYSCSCHLERHFFFGDSVRLPCPCRIIILTSVNHNTVRSGEFCRTCWAQGNRHDNHCELCQGNNWLSNPDAYAWRQAVRDKGMDIDIKSWSHLTGDEVWVHRGSENLSFVSHVEGLRGQIAEMTSLHRMLKQVAGVEMPDG